jgi:hypothetical protein
MLTSRTSNPLPTVVVVATMIALVGLVSVLPAGARITMNTIDPVAVVTDAGRHLVVRGPLACTKGERAFLRVTVSQRATGAVAEGHTRLICTGDDDVQQ